jgi:PAS domain S-box-containing protein
VVRRSLPLLVTGALAAISAKTRGAHEDARGSDRRARARLEFVARTGKLLEATPEPDAMLGEIVRLAVPDMAAMCIVDLVHEHDLRGAAVFSEEPSAAQALRELRARFPIDAASEHPAAVAARTGEPRLLAELPRDELRRFATSPEHLDLVLRLRYSTAVVVPLVARGRTLGVLTLLRFADAAPYTADDLELAVEIGRHAGLALDNARLFADLTRTDRQLQAVLGNLAAAVTVQSPGGDLVYVNQAAAGLLGCASPEEVLATAPEMLMDRFVVLDERGQPYDLADLPGRHALAGEEPEPALVRSIVKATGEERWMRIKATAVRDEAGAVALAVNIMEDVTDAYLAEQQQRFLSGASKLLTSSLDVDVTLHKTAWAAVPELADWCCVDVLDERGGLRRAALAGDDDEYEALDAASAALVLDPDDAGSIAHVLRDGRSILAREAEQDGRLDALRSAGTRSAMVVPMTAGGRIVGLITLGTSHSARRLGEMELALAEELGRRAGIAIENARVHAARSHIATTLQRSLLPPRLPTVAGVTIAARFRAAGEASDVGGDFYDLFAVDDAWMVVVGDVTGKGPVAAAITSLARYTIRTAATYERSPGAVLARLNAALATDASRSQLCTAVCARVETGDDGAATLTVASGGHPPPFVVHGAGGASAVAAPGPLLGAFATGAWEERRVVAAPGDAIVLYTDGVTDTRGADGERFGQDRLGALLQDAGGLEAEEIAARIDEALRAFERGPQRDDVALLVLRAGPMQPLARAG